MSNRQTTMRVEIFIIIGRAGDTCWSPHGVGNERGSERLMGQAGTGSLYVGGVTLGWKIYFLRLSG